MPEGNTGPESQQNTGSWNAAIFVGLVVVVAALFTLYVLLWDGGGAHVGTVNDTRSRPRPSGGVSSLERTEHRGRHLVRGERNQRALE